MASAWGLDLQQVVEVPVSASCGSGSGQKLRAVGGGSIHKLLWALPGRNVVLSPLGARRSTTVILKLTLRHKTDATNRAAADCADSASACRFCSFRRFYISFFPNIPVMLIVLDH